MSFVSTLFFLPIFVLVSIPLLASACITIWLALITLILQVLLVYVGVFYDMLISFFTLPVTTSSFLAFTPSKPNTPATGNSRRNSAHAQTQPVRGSDLIASSSVIGYNENNQRKKTYARSMVEAHDLSVSVDERRDFEGVGGWRSYINISRPERCGTKSLHDRDSRSASTSSVYSTVIDDDDRAWLSLNQRLELPSQIVTIGDSNGLSTVHSPDHMDSLDHRFHELLPASTHSYHTHRPHRHHHRSHTTSSLSTSNQHNGTNSDLSLALSNRPDRAGLSPPASPMGFRAPFTPQSQLQIRTRSNTQNLRSSQSNSHIRSSMDGANSSFGNSNNGEYFAFPDSALFAVESASSSGCTTPGTAASNEDRDVSPLQMTRLMAHYLTSVRSRRSSVSGPHYKDLESHERTG